ncbi:MAG: conjugal transfer protein TraF [Planctomycetes bacterium]|nr:conjugal transfer protein TraF [Planctomycetota bacterium]
MPRLLLLVLVLACCAGASAEEWVDFHTPAVGNGSTGVTARGAGASRYNPAFAAARPWERGEVDLLTMEFHLPTSFAASIHGDDFQTMFDIVEAANDVLDLFQTAAFDTPSTASLVDYRLVFGIFNKLDLLDSLSGDGVYSTASSGIALKFGNVFLGGDGLSFTMGGFAIAGAATIVDLESLRNYRFVDESGTTWDTFITTAATLSGTPTAAPTTPGGQQFSLDLQAAGYPAQEADILAKTAEDSGVNFGGVGASILLDFLINTRNGTGQSLESGVDPLEGNGSGFIVRGLSFYEFGISYGMPLPIPILGDWLQVGATVRFIQAYTFSHLLRVQDMTKDGVQDMLDDLQHQTQRAAKLQGESRFNVGFDVGITFTPQIPFLDTLTVSLVGRNLNGPEFRWDPATNPEPNLIRFDPQFVAGASYTWLADVGLPLTLSAEGELNRLGSDILPRYHSQFVRAALSFEPQWGGFGFGIRLGAFKNLADAKQSITFSTGLGLRLWFFHLDFAAQMGIERQEFGTTGDPTIIPQRFGASVNLGINIEF